MKKIFLVLVIELLFFSAFAHAQSEITQTPQQDEQKAEADPNQLSQGNQQTEFDVKAGITPDSAFYFVDKIAESVSVGNDPEKALEYKEEKIAEAKAMVEEAKNPEAAQTALGNAMKYNEIIEKEVSPEIKDKVEESATLVQGVINNMKTRTKGEQWNSVNDEFDRTIDKEKKIQTAAELSTKIKELCEALAKLDPLQYADTCRPEEKSPRWMEEQDRELTKEQEEQAKIFFEKLSECFENPKQCDCKGMGVQKFEDFCLEKSQLATKCEGGDKTSCEEIQSGSDPIDLLPDYLIKTFKQVESKYSRAKFDNFVPEECLLAKTKTPEECNSILFKQTAPQECIDAGLTGESKQDELECKKIMFEKNTPQECTDAGINPEDPDAPRKCAKIMFVKRSPEECLNAGLTGENRADERKCKELLQQIGEQAEYKPRFNKDCNSIKEVEERLKCYEEFYNNAQVQFKEDFMQSEPRGREFAAEMGAKNPDQPCPDGYCDKWEIEHPNDCPQDCGSSKCQSQEDIERLKEECKNKGQGARIENRGGCPWVICEGEEQARQNQVQQPSQDTGGIKCPDNICDDYEKMNPWACPEDCGGARQQYNQQPQNRIDQPREPNQQNQQRPRQQQFCSGQAPSCSPNGAPYCENGNWVCPLPKQEQQPMQPPQPRQEQQQPIEQQPQLSPRQPETQTIQEPAPAPQEPQEQQEPPSSPGNSEEEPSSASTETGSAITGRIITSIYGDENTRNGDGFLDYWFRR